MKKEKYQNKSNKINSKEKFSKRIIPLIMIFTIFISLVAYSKNSSAENNKVNNPSVELNVEKLNKDKVKISLNNFTPVVKSLQLSIGINGNAKFEEDSINWTVTSDSNDVKTHVKMSNDKKNMELFIVSKEALNKVGGILDICEINVSKVSGGSSAYSIDAKLNSDGIAYSYVVNDTNKEISGIDMANLSEDKLTISSSPIISLKKSNAIADGKIIISKYDSFDPKSYIEVTDEEDGVISNDKVSVEGKVNTKIVGSYSITYSVADSEENSSSLTAIVIVEDILGDDENSPIISVNNSDSNKLTISSGDNINLNDYITAVDYLGRYIYVEINGDYDLTNPGSYIITAVATDRFGKISEKEITLIVEDASIPDNPDVENKGYKFKATVTNSKGNIVVGKKFNLYKVEVKNRLFRSDSEELIYISTLESDKNGEISYEVEKPGKYILKQIDSLTGNEIAELEIRFELTEENKGNIITIQDIIIKDNTSEPESPDEPGNPDVPSNPENPDKPGNPDVPSNPENPDEPGNPDVPSNPENPDEPVKPGVPSNPENPDESGNNNDNKNDLPQTGQGIFYGITIFIALLIAGSGMYLVREKKKQ
ncbi:immunoglobulin-like domain-containing protein [uncultured Clostridium sp.]|uniref:immunoglobulin-like domain-containing protein n=1 Tax=uncultured Clostridium sp. TaxID=59620 RepID=UPI00262138CC|nr:immunoglobulin-like domain-containing protein [uncultured Clostridium sp.]